MNECEYAERSQCNLYIVTFVAISLWFNQFSSQVLPLGQRLSVHIIKEWLGGANRQLTEEQFQVVRNALSICSLPLYASLVFQEVSTK